jgi:hypothetical protein
MQLDFPAQSFTAGAHNCLNFQCPPFHEQHREPNFSICLYHLSFIITIILDYSFELSIILYSCRTFRSFYTLCRIIYKLIQTTVQRIVSLNSWKFLCSRISTSSSCGSPFMLNSHKILLSINRGLNSNLNVFASERALDPLKGNLLAVIFAAYSCVS